MKKIGRIAVFALAALLVLFTVASCKDANETTGKTGMVTFTEAVSKGLSFTEEGFDASDFYWSYTAATSGLLNTGAVDKPKAISDGKGLAGEAGPFSYGKWTFTLYAYKDPSRTEQAYSGVTEATISSASSTVAVTVKASQNGEGYAEFDVANITLCGHKLTSFYDYRIVLSKFADGSFVLQENITPVEGTNTYKLASGAWKATVNCYIDGVEDPAGTGTIYFNVFDNQTITIDGSLNEQTNYVTFTAEDGGLGAIVKETVDANTINTLTAPSAPVSESADPELEIVTTISLPENSLAKGGEASLSVTSYDVATANAGFAIENSSDVVVAALDLNLKVDNEAVTTFSDAVTVTTYINPGLGDNNVDVKYNGTGDQPTAVSYISKTGCLSFKTTHFSQFCVVTKSDYVAYNKSNTSFYSSLDDAIEAAASGDEVVLMKDIAISKTISIDKNLTINGNGHTIDASGVTRGLWIDDSNVTLTIKNLNMNGNNKCERGIQINPDFSNVNLNIIDCNISAFTYTIQLGNDANNCSIVIEDSEICGWAALNLWGKNSSVTVRNSILKGLNDREYSADGWNNFATICVEADTTGKYPNYYASSNNVLIENCEIHATQTTGNKQYHIVFNDPNSCDNSVRINGCTFFDNDGECSISAEIYGINNNLYVDDVDYVAYNSTDMAFYSSLDDAIKAAGSGDEVVLMKDIAISETISIVKSLTINGNGHTIDASSHEPDSRGLWVDADGVTLTVKNLIMDGKNSCERGIQINPNLSNVKLNIKDCDIVAFAYYAINVCNNIKGCSIEIDHSKISGWAALNIWGMNSNITVTYSTLIGINEKLYNADGWNNFATICVEADTTEQTDDHASGHVVLIENCEIHATETTGNEQYHIVFNDPASCDNEVRMNNCTFFYNDKECNTISAGVYGVTNKLYIDGSLYEESQK